MDFTPQQISILERLHSLGFEIVAFPMYANYLGIRQGRNAALLAKVAEGGLRLYGEPTILINGNFSACTTRNGHDMFVWKSQHVEATPELLASLDGFRSSLVSALNSITGRSP